jgi:hypothetical protein
VRDLGELEVSLRYAMSKQNLELKSYWCFWDVVKVSLATNMKTGKAIHYYSNCW